MKWRENAAELLRWVCVVPAAVLAGLAVEYACAWTSQLTMSNADRTASSVSYYLQLVLVYLPKMSAAVVAGALVAPRGRLAAAGMLAAGGVLLSFLIHVLAPARVGPANYQHLAAESAGLILGAMYVYHLERRRGQLKSQGR